MTEEEFINEKYPHNPKAVLKLERSLTNKIVFPEDFIRAVRRVSSRVSTHQVSIPAVVMEQLGLEKGSRVKFEISKPRVNKKNNALERKVTIIKYD